jgi:glycosyltransferase involved in cell wall biosynthesis/lauroyl/myristoyl acyltransferase
MTDKRSDSAGIFARSRDAVRTLALSIAVWLLYVPHYTALRLLGPRLGMRWVRVAANVHWLLTFVGAQRGARRALASMHPYFDARASVSQILRRHLRMKHECFARARVYNVNVRQEDRQADDLRWRLNPECADAAPRGKPDRGLIVVGFHYNFFQLSAAPLSELLPGVDVAQLRYRGAQCVATAASPVVRMAMKKALEADKRSGAKCFYLDESAVLVDLFRLLRGGGVLAVAADGMVADDFVEVPFFDGTFRVPTGWAKLAAATKSDIVLLCDRDFDGKTRDGRYYDHVRCDSTSDEAVYAAVAESVRVLEQMIREEPWGWHPWQRLRVEVGVDGQRRYHLKQFGSQDGEKLGGKQPDPPKRSEEIGNRRPRVAILANSLPPYRVHLHERILAEIPEVELWSLTTHDNAYQRWSTIAAPRSIRPARFGHGEPTNEQTKLRYSLREWLKAGRIIGWLGEHSMDAVFCQGCGDVGRMRIIRWCKRRDIPCFLTGDFNVCTDRHGPVKQWIKRLVYGAAVRWSFGLMPCGEHGRALLRRYGGDGKPTFMFPFVPDVELFENTPADATEQAQERYGLDPERRRIVFSARMMPAKRPQLALQAFAEIAGQRTEWDLVMVGDGPLRASLETSVPPELRERITWTGFLDDDAKVAGIYAKSDILLLPSDYEPWGVVIVEAAAAGLAIVASDVVGAAPELIQPGRNGALFASGNLTSLVAALRETTDDRLIDNQKRESRLILREWLDQCDPVAGFRAALKHCGLPLAAALAPRLDASDPSDAAELAMASASGTN